MNDPYILQRQALIATLQLDGIMNQAVLDAIAVVPRHLFVPEHLKKYAYENMALPIVAGQTISQPFVVARMTEIILADRLRLHKILEIGTGSGYQAAVLAQVADQVYSVERIEELSLTAQAILKKLSYNNVFVLHADGYLGWKKHRPYDAIIVTAAAPSIPQALLTQLAVGGRLVIPVDNPQGSQDLQLITRQKNKWHMEKLDGVLFVPMRHGVSYI